MKILVINTGSSSIKYQLFNMDRREALAAGMLERIGEPGSRLLHERRQSPPARVERPEPAPDHRSAMAAIMAALADPKTGAIGRADEIGAVGHRVVHGGESFYQPTLIGEETLAVIRANVPLAPMHNPANLAGIEAARALFPDIPQVAVFDTAFHQTMPPAAFLYGLPEELYRLHRIRRYGFHGTSHQHATRAAAQLLGRPVEELNLITIHLGNGSSITAVRGGQSVDTSMGMTPLEGLVMGTRCGDLDPAIIPHLVATLGIPLAQVEAMLNQESGLKGLCGESDMRGVLARRAAGDERAGRAFEVFIHSIRRYVGAYFAVLGRVDGLVFTAGIGQNSAEVRAEVCRDLDGLGVELDPARNAAASPGPAEIQAEDSRVKVLVVPANEELEIADQVLSVLKISREEFNTEDTETQRRGEKF